MKFLQHRIFSNIILFVLIAFLTTLSVNNLHGQVASGKFKPRVVITADPELDDNNSINRFLLYSSDFDIEGFIYTSSGSHGIPTLTRYQRLIITVKERYGLKINDKQH